MNSPATQPASAPETPVNAVSNHSIIHLLYRDGTGTLHEDWPLDRLGEALAEPKGLLWADFQAADEPALGEVQHWLRDCFQFHELAIEDALQESHVPKVDDWGSYLYLVFLVPRIDPKTDVLEFDELDVFLGSNYLVTYHLAPLNLIDRERGKIQRDPRHQLRPEPDFLLFRLLEMAVDQSLAAIEQLDERV